MPEMNSRSSDPPVWEPPPLQPLDEGKWQAWVANARAAEPRSRARYLRALKLAAIAVMLGLAVFWPGLVPYDTIVRFAVTGAAIVLMSDMLRQREWILAAAFGAIGLAYNPVAPLFGFSGEWQRAVVVASIGPFIASLAWNRKSEA